MEWTRDIFTCAARTRLSELVEIMFDEGYSMTTKDFERSMSKIDTAPLEDLLYWIGQIEAELFDEGYFEEE